MSDDLKPPTLTPGNACSKTRPTGSNPPTLITCELLRMADDLFGQGAIDLEQWQALKAKAEQSHKDSPAMNVAQEVDDPEA